MKKHKWEKKPIGQHDAWCIHCGVERQKAYKYTKGEDGKYYRKRKFEYSHDGWRHASFVRPNCVNPAPNK